MQIFIRKIPRGVTRKDLRAFVESALQLRIPLPFRTRGEVRDCRIIVIQDKNTGELDRHGIVSVHPEKAAEQVIKRLNRTRLNGRRVQLHQYFSRKHGSPRDTGERRRKNLEIKEEFVPHVQGLDEFRRTYGGG
jgi:RNA recognition motif-containing protein